MSAERSPSNGNVCGGCGVPAVLKFNGQWLCTSCVQIVLDAYHDAILPEEWFA